MFQDFRQLRIGELRDERAKRWRSASSTRHSVAGEATTQLEQPMARDNWRRQRGLSLLNIVRGGPNRQACLPCE